MGRPKGLTAASTPWARGRLGALGRRPTLLFGQMYEDFEVEASLFPRAGRVFTIASAGTTSMALSVRGLEVTAVDINLAQVEYVRERLGGAPAKVGTADRLFAFCRRTMPMLGMPHRSVEEFLRLDDPSMQLDFWRRRLDTARLRLGLRILVNRVALQLVYHRAFLEVMPARFDRLIRARFERCFGRHPNRTNPYAWRLLLGRDPPGLAAIEGNADRIHLVHADAAAFLERCAPASFNGFSLSNVLDGTDNAYASRLMAAVRRSARPGAVAVLRSFAEPDRGESLEWVSRDRSLLWGVVRVERF